MRTRNAAEPTHRIDTGAVEPSTTPRFGRTRAPFLVLPTAAALGLALFLGTATPAAAGTCTEDGTTGGTWNCTGAADMANDTSVTLDAASGETLLVNETSGFGLNVATGKALTLTGATGSTGINVTLAGAVTTRGTADTADAIEIDHDGGGNVSFTANGAITSAAANGITAEAAATSADMTIETTAAIDVSAGRIGINATHRGTGNLSVTTAAISSVHNGINILTTSSTDAATITANGAITASRSASGVGIAVSHGGTADLSVTANANVTGGTHGIDVSTSNSTAANKLVVTAAANAVITGRNTLGIDADHAGSGNLEIAVNAGAGVTGAGGIEATTAHTGSRIDIDIAAGASITGTAATDPTAISMTGGAGHDLTITGGTNAQGTTTITGALKSSGGGTTDKLTLNGAAFTSGTLSLDGLEGFAVFEKSGAGAWTLTGTQPTDQGFDGFMFEGGTLRLENASLQKATGSAINIGSGETLEIVGASAILGGQGAIDLAAGGTINLATTGDATATDDTLTVHSLRPVGGSVTLNVALVAGGTDTSDQIIVNNNIPGTGASAVTLNVIVTGTHADLDGSGITLIDAPSAAASPAGSFTLGTVTLNGTASSLFTLRRNAADGDWMFMSPVTATGGKCALGNNFAVSCAGAANSGSDSSIVVTARTGGTLNVTSSGFGHNAASGAAVTFATETDSAPGASGHIINLSGPVTARGTTATDHAIALDHDGPGAASLTAGGAVTAASGHGISADTTAAGTSLAINANANITSRGNNAINAVHRGTGDFDLTVGGNALLSGFRNGISATRTGASGTLDITVNDGAGVTGGDAVFASSTAGDIAITVNGTVTSTTATAIRADQAGNGNTEIAVSGNVASTAAGTPTAISMTGGASQRLILHTTAVITGAVTGSNATLELAAAAGQEDGASNLATALADFTGFTTLEKTGAGTWVFTGEQASGKAFTTTDFSAANAGRLRLQAATFRPGALDIGANTLEAVSLNAATPRPTHSTIHGSVDNSSGMVSLANDATRDQLTVTGRFTTGGMVTLNVNFTDGSADALVLQGGTTGSSATSVTLRVTGTTRLSRVLLPQSPLIEISGTSTNAATAFTAGNLIMEDGTARAFTLSRNSDNHWVITDVTIPGATIVRPCMEASGTSGRFDCSNPATVTQQLEAASGELLQVRSTSDFSAIVARGNAVNLVAAAGATGIDAEINGAITSQTAIGIDVDHAGTGNIDLTTSGAVAGTTAGIDVDRTAGSGDITITADNDVTATAAAGTAIDVQAQDATGAIQVEIGGEVDGGASGNAIAMSGGASHTLIIGEGGRIAAGDSVSATNLSLQFDSADIAAEDVFDLSALADFPASGTSFTKTGAGRWTFTGDQPTDRAFARATFTSGVMLLRNAAFRPGAAFAIPAEGVLQVLGTANTIYAPLIMTAESAINMATLTINQGTSVATQDRLAVTGEFTGGGAVSLDIAYDANAETWAADLLALQGGVTANPQSPTSINLVVRGDDTLDQELPEGGVMLIDVTGASPQDAFTAGECSRGIGSAGCSFALTQTDGDWFVTSFAAAGGIEAAVYESYAASLAQLSRLSSMQVRLANRVWAGQTERGVWASLEVAETEVTPGTATNATSYEPWISRFRFGADLPLEMELGHMTLGGSAWIGQGDTDVAVASGESGEIEFEGYAIAASANWRIEGGFYVDAQLEYAAYAGDLSAGSESLAADNDANSFGMAAELGLPVAATSIFPEAVGITLTPHAQVIWSDVAFDNFTDANGALVSVQDGRNVFGRIGLAVDGEWSQQEINGGMHVGAALLAPIDGETKVVSGSQTFVSELEEVAADLSLGASFLIQDRYAVSADVATSQGDEVEEYRANLGLRFRF